jgi:catechol 2,3-dioxygenase-like lactoylglutathione lyase family enzyme
MYKALYLSPMIPSFHLKETAGFFTGVLQFEYALNSDNYIILHKNNLTVHLLPAGENIGQMEFYLEVDDVDAVWHSVKEKLQHIKHREPFNREYGMREIHIAIPQTNTLLFIGQEIK